MSIVDQVKECRICYSDEESSRLFSPCRCTGTSRYVHDDCLTHWLIVGPESQHDRCSACQYAYKKTWRLRHPRNWTWPRLGLNWIEILRTVLHIHMTYKLILGFKQVLDGTRCLWRQALCFFLWRFSVFSRRAQAFYKKIGRRLLSSFMSPKVQDIDD